MASGLSGQLGYVQETTYATPVTPVTRFIEFTSETLDYAKQTVDGGGIAAGRVFAPGNARYIVGVGGSGDITFNVPSKGAGFWFYNLFGQVSSVTHAGSPNAYTHTFTPKADMTNISFTMQKGVPEAGSNTVDPYTFQSCVVNSLQLTMGQNALLTAKATIDAQNVVVGTPTLATASYPSAPNYFSFANINNTLTVNGSAYAGIKSFDMTLNNQLDLTRMYLGAGGKKAQPIRGNLATATGTLTADYVDTTLTSAFLSDAEVAFVTTFTAANIATSYNEQITITLNGLRLNGQLPQIGGPGIVPLSIGFDAYTPVAGGQACTIVYQTTDATP
jgi:hypothetical protein